MRAAPKAGQRSAPSRIGSARPSHLITTAGVGAVVDLPSMSVVVRGLDWWHREGTEPIVEPRLLEQVRAALGQQVRELVAPPWDPAESDQPYARTGVPVTPFPRWLRCPACHRLGPMDPPGQFEMVHRVGRRPDLAKWVHSGCDKQQGKADGKRRACVPARFLVTCDEGHLDDFPFVTYVHRGAENACDGSRLTMSDSGSTLGPRVLIKCTECSARRSVQEAAGSEGPQALPRCRGRHPHLQRFEACGRSLKLTVLGASNLWFSVTASALHLPTEKSVQAVVEARWEQVGIATSPDVLEMLVSQMPVLKELRDRPLDEVWSVVQAVRAAGGPVVSQAGSDLLGAEWSLLSHPTTQQEDVDFRARPTPVPPDHTGLLEQVVQVTRLREVKALVGFTRMSSPARGELEPTNRMALSTSPPTWVPAFEQRGEGIFLQLPEARVAAWEQRVAEHPDVVALKSAHRQWSANRAMPHDGDLQVPRLLLLHTLSHLLLRQVALECGYSSSSIRERLYLGTPAEPTAGILLSTAASDSEGTLGGLVALGEAHHLGRLLTDALDAAHRCSSDPLCAEQVPEDPSDALHAAACHACLFASETSCESGNRWLHRGVLVPLHGAEDLAFPRE